MAFSLPLPFLKKKKKQEGETKKEAPEIKPGEKLAEGMISIQDVIAPPAIEVDAVVVRKIRCMFSGSWFRWE